MNNEISDYKSALYNVGRKITIIGLTGYTGSGCSTAKKILTKSSKINCPNYQAIRRNKTTYLEQKGYKKLEREWKKLDWLHFTAIEFSKVIFSFAIKQALDEEVDSRFTKLISLLEKSEKNRLTGLEYLFDKSDGNIDLEKLLDAYEYCCELYYEWRKLVNNSYTSITWMQEFGNEIRKYGKILTTHQRKKVKPNPICLALIPKKINILINAYFKFRKFSNFVVDAFRNPYEVEYFKHLFSEFYLVGIHRNLKEQLEAHRDLSIEQFRKIHNQEKCDKSVIKRTKKNVMDWMTTQDIEECLKRSDVFVPNEFEPEVFSHLRFGLIKLITLIRRPGAIPPTQDERCMQIAMTVRQASGCISRKVGAVIIDKERWVIGVGWNDPPKGQIPCSLRTYSELLNGSNNEIFSKYEQSQDFLQFIKKKNEERVLDERPFCFKSEYSEQIGEKKSEFTRALHAEENAFFQASRNAKNELTEATLYTTDRTCTLCAKKAYQLGIQRIVFIDNYSDISIDQTINVGSREIEVDRFMGITGAAYFKLYVSLMPEKDLIKLLED